MLNRLLVAIAMVGVLAPAVPALAKRMPPPAWHFDRTGWTLLGSQTVKGKVDRDVIVVGKYEGKFDQLSIVVEDSDIDLVDLTVLFSNGEKWSPALKHSFKEGARSRAIDLPGTDRRIEKIALTYKNLPGGGNATVSVFGRDTKQKPSQPGTPSQPPPPPPTPVPPPPPTPTPYHFDDKGWTLLGTGTVHGGVDHDTFRVNTKAGFDQLTMVVADSDLDLKSMVIVFGNGQRWEPKLAHYFKEGSRTRVIDLPGKDRKITRIQLTYSNLPGGGKASVQLYGRDVGRPAPPPPAPVTWENKGWTKLGTTTADGWKDSDRLTVGNKGPYTEVMFVVTGSDLELTGVVITLGNGEKFELKGTVAFKEGSRTKPIDIPGAQRRIKSVDFAYQNLPGGGRASVEVWARLKAAPAPQPQPGTPPPPPPGSPPPPGGVDVRDHR